MSPESCRAASFSGKGGALRTGRESEWAVSWSRAVASATELINQLPLYVYTIAVRITVVWHVSSMQLAGSSSGESVTSLWRQWLVTPESVKRISSFEWLTHESHITTASQQSCRLCLYNVIGLIVTLLVVVSCRGLGCLLQFQESLLPLIVPLVKTVSPLCRMWEQCACTALTADWLWPGSVCNQSDGAVGGTMLETE